MTDSTAANPRGTDAVATGTRGRRRWVPWLAAANAVFLLAAVTAAIGTAIGPADDTWVGLAVVFPEIAFLALWWPFPVWGVANVLAVIASAAATARRAPDQRERWRRAAVGATVATFVVFLVNMIPAAVLLVGTMLNAIR